VVTFAGQPVHFDADGYAYVVAGESYEGPTSDPGSEED
jgi:hypothetical protein